MTQPASPDPTAPRGEPGGYSPPGPSFDKQQPAPQNWAPTDQQGYGQGSNQGYGQGSPSNSGMAGGGPFSPLVGRPLTSDETLWSMLAHIGAIPFGFLVPLVVMLTKGNESPYTRYHSVEALNFQITLLIGYFVSGVLCLILIGFVLIPVLAIAHIVFCIIAGIAANKGEQYRYPLNLRLVK